MNLSKLLIQVYENSANESIQSQHKEILPEHSVIGILKLEDDESYKVIKPFIKDPITFRRRLRYLVGNGKREYKGQIVHRSEIVKEVYKKSESLSKTLNLYENSIYTFFYELLKIKNKNIALCFQEFMIDKNRFKEHLINHVKEGIKKEKERKQKKDGEKFSIEKRAPLLNSLGRNLNQAAAEGMLGELYGRKDTIVKMGQILTQRTKSNPVLIGEAGVGKTAIVEGFVSRLIQPNVHPDLANMIIIELSPSMIVAGTKYRGEFEEKANKIILELKSNPDIVLFIDELHSIVGAGTSENGNLDISNILKPALARGDVKCIGATTPQEYQRYIVKEKALERRFQTLYIPEPTQDETMKILEGLKPKLEEYYQAVILPECISYAIDASVRFMTERRLPDKAVDILEQSLSQLRMKAITFQSDLKKTEKKELTQEDVARVISQMTGIPLSRLTAEDKVDLFKIEEKLNERVKGQDHAVKEIAEAIRIAKSGLRDPNKPLGVFLFLGPSGVGKTLLAKVIAEEVMGGSHHLIRFNMSEYGEKNSINKLLGAPPGYIGYHDEGKLYLSLKANPYSVLLFDEIEKAHPDIFNIFLQVFDEGELTDAKGRDISFKNSLIVLTSNIGATIKVEDQLKKVIGFIKEAKSATQKNKVNDQIFLALRKYFKVEILNRIDKAILFNQLKKDHLKAIVDIQIKILEKRLSDKNIKINLSDKVYDRIIETGYSEDFGARELERIISELIVKPLSIKLLESGDLVNKEIRVDIDRNSIIFI